MSEQRLISAEQAKETLEHDYAYAAAELLDEVPTIDPETLPVVRELRAQLAERKPVVHAHWIRYDDTDGWNCSSCDCDICGYDDNPAEYGVNFCERCGAKMDEATE